MTTSMQDHFDGLASQWTEKYRTRPSFEARLEVVGKVLVREMERFPRPRVLDVGSGAGIFSRLCSLSGADAVGIDASPEMILVAQAGAVEQERLLSGAGFPETRRGSVCFGPVSALPALVRSGGFDLVLLISVLEYQDKPSELIRFSTGQLAPGGRLIYTCPNERATLRRAEGVMARMPAPRNRWRRLDLYRDYLALRQRPGQTAWSDLPGECGLKVEYTVPLPLGNSGARSHFSTSSLTVSRRDAIIDQPSFTDPAV